MADLIKQSILTDTSTKERQEADARMAKLTQYDGKALITETHPWLARQMYVKADLETQKVAVK
jgi:hypothetical protein